MATLSSHTLTNTFFDLSKIKNERVLPAVKNFQSTFTLVKALNTSSTSIWTALEKTNIFSCGTAAAQLSEICGMMKYTNSHSKSKYCQIDS